MSYLSIVLEKLAEFFRELIFGVPGRRKVHSVKTPFHADVMNPFHVFT